MAKALLLNALHDALADYVLGLSPEKLKVGVWSGKIVLDDLQVNPEAVNQLRLPVTILHGTVKKLEVHIPWAQLGSKAVKVFIEGVGVLAAPVDKDSWDDEEVSARTLDIKRKWLEKTENEFLNRKDGKDEEDSNKKKGFVDKLVQRIVDNIEIKVTDVHIRYEDSALVPGQTVSAGLTLKSFLVTTTDEKFHPTFVDRTKDPEHNKKVHKLARVDGFSVYWRIDEKARYESLPAEMKFYALKEFVDEQMTVPEGDNGGGLARGDVIRPTSFELKFIHNDDPDDVVGPKFEASFEMNDVRIDVRAEQYEQILQLKDSFTALSNWQTFFPYRPKTSPLQDPRAWWRYAYVCVNGKPGAVSKLRKILAARTKYVPLFERIAATSSPESDKRPPASFESMGLLKPLSKEEQSRLDALEEDLPAESILMFRTMARNNVKRVRKEAQAAGHDKDDDGDADKGKKKKGWFGWFGGGDKKTEEDGDVSIEELGDFVAEKDESKEVPPDYVQMRVAVRPRGDIRLYGRRDLPLLEAKIDTAVTAEMREDASLWVNFSLAQLEVEDLFTQNAVFSHILKVRGREDMPEGLSLTKISAPTAVSTPLSSGGEVGAAGGLKGPRVSVNVAISKTALDVEIWAAPTDVVYNREVVDALLSVFQARPAETQAYMTEATKSLQAAQKKAQELGALAISVAVDAAAPKIIVPVSSSIDKGFLLLDTGHAVIKGGTVGDAADGVMSYDMELSDITLRLPKRKALLQKGTKDALIEPFKVKAGVSMGGDASKPGMAVGVEVLPGINGVISSGKITSLFSVLDYVTKADLNAPGSEDVGPPPVGLAAPNTPGTDGGVQLMGGGMVAPEGLGDVTEELEKSSQREVDDRKVLMEIKVQLPTVSLLLVELEEIPASQVHKDSGLLMEIRGTAVDLSTRTADMLLTVHLQSLTLEDRARPDDSPFRYMISSIPDKTSHGGLIHITYWMATSGGPRPPPDSVAETNQEYSIVLDARFSTLELALDKDCITTVTPFYRAITRMNTSEQPQQQQQQQQQQLGWKQGRDSKPRDKSGVDADTRSIISSARMNMVEAAKLATGTKESGPPAVLVIASLTSVSLELVKSDPWETTLRAAVDGLGGSFSTKGGEDGGMEASLKLVGVHLTDTRPEARNNAYTGILAPLLPSSNEALLGARDADEDDDGEPDGTRRAIRKTAKGDSSGEKDSGGEMKEEGDRVEPVMQLKAKIEGGATDVQMTLASLACNLMVEPIQESLVVMMGVNAALMEMLAPPESAGSGQGSGNDETTPARGSSMVEHLDDIDEEEEYDQEDNDAVGALTGPVKQSSRARGGGTGRIPTSETNAPGGVGAVEGAKGQGEPSSISARCELNDWRINLIETPSNINSKVMVMRASLLLLFARAVTPGDGGESIEDTVHLSLLNVEALVDQPAALGGGDTGGDEERGLRKIHQMLEPLSAELHGTALSARGSVFSVSMRLFAGDMDCRLSYKDLMLLQGIAEQATAAPPESTAGVGSSTALQEGSATPESTGNSTDITPRDSHDSNESAPPAEAKKTANAQEGKQPEAVMAVSMSASCSLARIVLVNDYEGQGVPVLMLSSRQFKAEGSGFREDFSLRVSGTMGVSFFNMKVVRWEPVVEPWRPVLKASLGMDMKGRMTIRVTLTCDKVVLMNLTSDFMESFLSTYWMLFSAGIAKDLDFGSFSTLEDAVASKDETTNEGDGGADIIDELDVSSSASPDMMDELKNLDWADELMPVRGGGEGSVNLNNRSGLQLLVGTTDQPDEKIKFGPMETAPMPFHTRRHHANADEFDLRGKAAIVTWEHEGLRNSRVSPPPLQVDRPGVVVYPLHPVERIPSDHVVSAPVVVEAYQDQRFDILGRKWKTPFMPGDGPEFWSKDWSRGDTSEAPETPLDSIALPDNDKWEWRDNWHVDFSKEVGTQIDPSGWEYGVDFNKFNLTTSSRTHRDLDAARRRKWIRTRAPKPLPLDDPFRELYVAWEVTATPQGRLEATLRSTVQIVNDTDLALDLRALCSAWPVDPFDALDTASGTGELGTQPMGSVAAGSTLHVPVKLAYASKFQVRPLPNTSAGGEASTMDLAWSEPVPLLANHVDTSQNHWVSCAPRGSGDSGSGPVRLVAHAEITKTRCLTVTVLPAVTIVNCLPCPLSFRAVLPPEKAGNSNDDSRSGGGSARSVPVLESGVVPTAQAVNLHALEVGDGARISFKIAHHGWSPARESSAVLPSGREELRKGRWAQQQVVFKLPTGSGDGGCLQLRCQFEPRAGSACPAVRLYVYCTHWLVDRSGLSLGFGVGDKRRLPVPRVKASAVTSANAAEGTAAAVARIQQNRSVHLSPVSDVSCASNRGVAVATATTRSLLYVDREYTLKADSLPSRLRGATLIRTACSDKNNDNQFFMRFRSVEASTVHVLFDRRCTSPPSWLTSSYRATSMRAHVTHKTTKGKTADNPFVVWTRNFPAGAWVNLGGNKAPKASTMYVVIVTEQEVVPAALDAAATRSSPSSAVAATSTRRKIASREDLEESWTLGTEGLTLCNANDDEIRVAVAEGAGAAIGSGATTSGSGTQGRGGHYGDDDFMGYTPDAWSDELAVSNGSSGVFQVEGTRGEMYELALRAETCPGTFRRTMQVTVVPRYCIVNLLDGDNIWLKQPGAPDSSAVAIPPGGRVPWHWMMEKGSRASRGGVRVRTEGTAWSYGDVKIDQVGTTALHIPFFGETEDLDGQYRGQAGGPAMQMPEAVEGGATAGGDSGRSGSTDGRGTEAGWSGGRTRLDKLNGEQAVIHVDVKLADDVFTDEYAVLVVFWKANKNFAPIYSVRNTSPVNLRLCQAVSSAQDRRNLAAKAVWKMKPGDRRQIGWAYPSGPRVLLLAAGTGPKAVELNSDTVGNYAKIPTGMTPDGDGPGSKKGPATVWASVVVMGGTKVIRVRRQPPKGAGGVRRSPPQQGQHHQMQMQQQQSANVQKEAAAKLKEESEAPAIEVSVDMAGFGLSLVGPISGRRREVLYAQVSDIQVKLSQDRLSSVQASIGSMQVDNYIPDGLYPVLLSGRAEEADTKGERRGKDSKTTPFLALSLIKENNQTTNTAHFNYVAFRMLEVDIMADRASVLHLLVLFKPVSGYLEMRKHKLDSRAWVAKRTAEVLERGAAAIPGGFVDVDEVRRSARIERKYFKTLRFHPIMCRISYMRTPASNKLYDAAAMPIINKIPTLVKSNVDLASYLVEDTFGSIQDVSKNISRHYTVAATSQVLFLVGSIRALGSPADLISNVGGGAKALVYAPAQGLVQGPAEFFEGVGRGAQSFVKGTVHGVFSSVAGVGGAVSDTVSMLSFDDEYKAKREREKNKNMAKQGGVGHGFVQGASNITGGIASGVGGIFTAPVKGAKSAGVGGFFKGVGKGLVGAVVKPVVGVSDAAVSVVQGISNEADDAQKQEQLRPPRALSRDADTGQLVLDAFSMEAAEAQALVEKGVDGKGDGKGGKYESHTSIADLTIIFADTRVILVKRGQNDSLKRAKATSGREGVKSMQMVSKLWEEVSRVEAVDRGVIIRRYDGGDITLKATSEASREELYCQFYQHREKMGDPTGMKSPQDIFGAEGEREMSSSTVTMRAHSNAVQQSLDDHVFGSVNRMEVPYLRLSDTQILNRAEKQLQSVGVGNWCRLDMIAWELVQNWDSNNTGLGASRCVCVVFINATASNVQFHNIRRRDGLGYRLLLGPMCDRDTHQLKPGGVAILFGWGHQQSNILKKGYVVLTVETSAFSGVYAVQREKVSMTSKSGFQAGFLEKTMEEWWSKQIVVIK